MYIAKREHISVKIDFLNIVFDNATVEEVLYMLNVPDGLFSVRDGNIAYKDYQKLYQFGEIKVYGNPKETPKNLLGLGAYLALGGKGCRELERFVGNYGLFIQQLIKTFGEKSFHVTRIDLAIDDINNKPFFTVEQLSKKCDKKEFICTSKKHRNIKSVNEKHIARTLYIGVGKSEISFRFYDKDMEQLGKGIALPKGITSWKRTEIQLRKRKAHKFALDLKGQSLEEMTCGLLKQSLRFVIPDKQQKNKSRWKTCQFWERFLGSVKPIKISVEKEESTLQKTQDWVRFGGALSAMKAFQFLKENNALGELKDLENALNGVYYSEELTHKLISHAMELDRTDLIQEIYDNTRKMNVLENKH